MAWIESHDTLGAHPKTRKLARLLGINRVQVVGHLQFFWWWAMNYAPDGDLARFDELDLATGAEWEGEPSLFVEAMVAAGFVDCDGDATSIHDWQEYGGKLIRRKTANAERMKEARAAHVAEPEKPQSLHVSPRAEHVQDTCETRVKPEKSREEKSREQDLVLSSESNAPARETPKPAKAKAERRSKLPEDWQPNEKQRDALGEQGYSRAEIDAELFKFRNFHLHKGDVGLDWGRAFANWMARSRDFAPPSRSPNGHAPPGKRFSTELSLDDLMQRAGGTR